MNTLRNQGMLAIKKKFFKCISSLKQFRGCDYSLQIVTHRVSRLPHSQHMSGQEGDILIVAHARLESNWCSLCSMDLLLGVSMQDWQKIGSCMISFGIT